MKNTKLIWGVVGLIVVVGIVLFTRYDSKNNVNLNSDDSNPLNITYVVGDQNFNLVDGKSELATSNSSAKNTLSIFGEPVYGDLDKDGDNDAALMLVNNPGGSGTFYYAVLAINNNGSYVATNTMLLGDRIAPQTINIQDGRAVYNFAERKGTDPMTTPPSIGKSVWVHYSAKDNTIGEWVKDFEGEMDDQTMVDTYIRANIKTLTPTKPVLGGSWYVVSISVNPITKIGAVIYEDGHIQDVAMFKYITNRSGVTIENISTISTNDKYIHPVKWPVAVKVIDSKFSCATSLVDGYCIIKTNEGAAGSTYTEYTYSKSYNNKTAKLNFTIQSVQCLNYDEPNKSECLQKQANYDILPVVNVLFNSFN